MAVEASSLMGFIILCRTGMSSCRTRKQSFSISLILARSCCKSIKSYFVAYYMRIPDTFSAWEAPIIFMIKGETVLKPSPQLF